MDHQSIEALDNVTNSTILSNYPYINVGQQYVDQHSGFINNNEWVDGSAKNIELRVAVNIHI